MPQQVVEGAVVTLPMDVTIETVHTLQPELVEALARGGPLAIDAAAVDRCDTAGLQLLLAAHVTGRARGVDIQITRATPALTAVADSLGLADQLGLAATETSDA